MMSGGVPGGVGTTIRMALEGNDSAWAGARGPEPNNPSAAAETSATDQARECFVLVIIVRSKIARRGEKFA